jgi:hypothetical protein
MGGTCLNAAPGIHAALLEILRPIDGGAIRTGRGLR